MRVSAVPALAAAAAILGLLFLGGCGGNLYGNQTVSQIIVTPTTISLNEGDVATLSATAQNSAGQTVAADISFTSNNSQIASVSPGGLICGGVWDPTFVFCNATQGTGGVGQETITAHATAYPSVTAPATVYVHEKVDRVNVILNTPCTSMGQNVSAYSQALSTSAPGCSPAAPCDITSTVGPISFGSNDTSIVSAPSSTYLVAGAPGSTTVFATVSGVNSLGTPYETCRVASILVHSSTGSQTSFLIGGGNTVPLTADVLDSNNQPIAPTLTWASSNIAATTVAVNSSATNAATVTGVDPGTTYITATCSYPNCNKNVPAQYSQNVVTVAVGGNTSTTVYAASTNSTMLVPFNISTDTPGTAITLPYTPNSIIADPGGKAVYLGSSSGLMAVNISSGAVTTYSASGAVVAVSPNGTYLLLSDSAANALHYVNISTGTLGSTYTFPTPNTTVTSDAYTPDSGFNEWVTGPTYGFGSPSGFTGAVTLASTANALDIMAQGGLTYITSASGRQIYVYSTCNQSQQQVTPLSATNPTLIKALPNGTGAVAADSPDIDVITTPSTLGPGCPVPVTTQSTINSYDLGAGSFTAEQMFVSSNNSAAWIVPNLPEILYFDLSGLAPTTIPLAGGATPEASAYDGGVTLDGAHAYFGASDNTVHRIDVPGLQDVAQIAVGLKDSSGNATAPNLVCVVPQ
jgi:hypothetical protein